MTKKKKPPKDASVVTYPNTMWARWLNKHVFKGKKKPKN